MLLYLISYALLNPGSTKPFTMKTMSVNNVYAFFCGLAVYAWHSILNVPTDLVVGVIKAALFGAAGMAGKELFSYIRKAVIIFFKSRKSKRK